MKRTLAVLSGLITIIVLSTATDVVLHRSGVFPPMGQPMGAALWWFAIGYRFAYTFLGGWISAKLDPQPGMRATWILTGLGVVLGLAGIAVSIGKPELGPAWYAWGVAVTGPLACWLGGTFYNHNPKRSEAL